jgi:hypothetical protein
MPDTRPKPSVVVFVVDVPGMSRFYREVASMTVVEDEEDHVVLEIAGLQLVIHALRGEPRPSRDSRGHVLRREDSYLKICLPVASLARARAKAAELGGFLGPPDQEWQARGFRACDGHDPEGNVLQLRENAPTRHV